MNERPALILEDLYKSFGENEVLKGIDLTVEPHEVVCLIGVGLGQVHAAQVCQPGRADRLWPGRRRRGGDHPALASTRTVSGAA